LHTSAISNSKANLLLQGGSAYRFAAGHLNVSFNGTKKSFNPHYFQFSPESSPQGY